MRTEKIVCDICGSETESVSIFPIKKDDVTKDFEVCTSCQSRIALAIPCLTPDIEINGVQYSLEALNLFLGKHCLGTPPQIKF
jgi:transcription elongation factor Elf1